MYVFNQSIYFIYLFTSFNEYEALATKYITL